MSNPQENDSREELSQTELHSLLFAQLVIQQSNMAMMMLGKVPHPESGKTVKDLESAQLFIGQLEMLETKTKGNLTREEESLLKQSLMSLRLGYVDAVNASETPQETTPSRAPEAPPAPQPESAPAAPATDSAPEHRPKFTKKY